MRLTPRHGILNGKPHMLALPAGDGLVLRLIRASNGSALGPSPDALAAAQAMGATPVALIAAARNAVMTRMFPNICAPAGMRRGWLYGPPVTMTAPFRAERS